MSVRHSSPGIYQRCGKRVFDVLAGGAFLAVSLPVQGVVAGVVRGRLGSPVFFRQERPGLGGEPFPLVKFRTMTDAADEVGRPLSDSERLTRLGRFLRSTSLDELPQLWNVVRGDMSLVGPRPLLVKYLPLYTSEQSRRHDVSPGLTGWAQVNGRNSPGWHEKLAMDTWYADHVSLRLDLRILRKTVVAVFARGGISAQGHATAPQFSGESTPASSAQASGLAGTPATVRPSGTS